MLGTVNSAAFGSSNQLVARFPAECGHALALGVVAAGALVLLPQALLRLGAHPTHIQQVSFFSIAALYSLVAVAAVCALLRRHWHDLQHGRRCSCRGGPSPDSCGGPDTTPSGPPPPPPPDDTSIDASLLGSGERHGQRALGEAREDQPGRLHHDSRSEGAPEHEPLLSEAHGSGAGGVHLTEWLHEAGHTCRSMQCRQGAREALSSRLSALSVLTSISALPPGTSLANCVPHPNPSLSQ